MDLFVWLSWLKHCLLHWIWGLPENPNTYLIAHTFIFIACITFFVCIYLLLAFTFHLFSLYIPNTTTTLHLLSKLHTSLFPLLTFPSYLESVTSHTILRLKGPPILVEMTTPFVIYLPHTLTISHFKPLMLTLLMRNREILWTIAWHNNNLEDLVLEPLHG